MIRIFLILFFISQLGNAQFNKAAFNIKGSGATYPARQGIIFDWVFAGTVQCGNCVPAEPPANGYNTANGQYLSPFRNLQSSTGYAVTQETDTVSTAGTAVRFESRVGDPLSSSSVRAEIDFKSSSLAQPDSCERWYGWRIYLAEGYRGPPNTFGQSVIAQWHDNGTIPGDCPPLQFQTYNNKLYLTRAPQCGTLGITSYEIMPSLLTDQWVDIVVHVIWRVNATGTLQCWVNGVNKVNQVGNVRTQEPGGNNLKYGNNNFNMVPGYVPFSLVDKTIFFMTYARIGDETSNYASVAPGP